MTRPDDGTPPDDDDTPKEVPPKPLVRPLDPDQSTETVPAATADVTTGDATTQDVPPVAPAPSSGTGTATLFEGKRTRLIMVAAGVLAVLLITAGITFRALTPGPPAETGARPTVTATTSTTTRASTVPPAPSPTLVVPSAPARPSDALSGWAGRVSAVIGVPVVALQAYAYAQLLVQGTNPQCHLGWTTLAGIGQVQSQHGQAGGAVLDKTGRSNPTQLGPPLDGQEGRPLVPDSDAGAYDGDADFDHGMGPLQLPPAAWRAYASDADNDQIEDPYDIDDESLATARLLCATGQDLGQITGWTSAIAQLRASEAFAHDVFEASDSYGQRTKNVE